MIDATVSVKIDIIERVNNRDIRDLPSVNKMQKRTKIFKFVKYIFVRAINVKDK